MSIDRDPDVRLVAVNWASSFAHVAAFLLYCSFSHGWHAALPLLQAAPLYLLLCALPGLGVGVAQQRVAQYLVMGADLVMVSVTGWRTGLPPELASIWMLPWPVYAFSVMGWRHGMVWSAVALVASGVHWAYPVMPGVPVEMAPSPALNAIVQTTLLLLMACYAGLARRAQDRHVRRIGAQHASLMRRASEADAMLTALQQANLERTQLFAQLSHEFRTPLNGIVGFAQLLDKQLIDPHQRGQLAQIKTCSDALLQVVNDVLDFTKLENRVAHLEVQDFDVTQTVSDAMVIVESQARAKALRLAARLPDSLGARGDPIYLRQILVNLLANGIKFTPVGEVMVRCSTQRTGEDVEVLVFEVEDTGIGIPKEAREQLFAPFGPATERTARTYGGSGLGLAICKRLIDTMNGAIEVMESEAGGTCFRFQIPRFLDPSGA